MSEATNRRDSEADSEFNELPANLDGIERAIIGLCIVQDGLRSVVDDMPGEDIDEGLSRLDGGTVFETAFALHHQAIVAHSVLDGLDAVGKFSGHNWRLMKKLLAMLGESPTLLREIDRRRKISEKERLAIIRRLEKRLREKEKNDLALATV